MKETEFDRYERMKKLERETEVEKRKLGEFNQTKKEKRRKLNVNSKKHNWNQVYALTASDDEYDEYDGEM